MAKIDRIVNVQISLNTIPIATEDFSTLLIAGPHVGSLVRVETITGADQLLDMGLSNTDPLYLAANDGFSQIPRPRQIKIGRRQVDVVSIVPIVREGATYKLTIRQRDSEGNAQSFDFEYVAGTGVTAETITDGIKALTDAETALKQNVVSAGGVLTITNQNNGDPLSVATNTMLTIETLTAANSIQNDLTAILSEDNAWYGLCITSRTQQDILDAAEWTESNNKLFGTAIAEPGAYDAAVTTDTGSKLQENNYYRTHWWYHANAATDFEDVAVMTRCFAVLPGGETWANKQLNGITTDKLSETQYLTITSKGGNTFEPFRNVSITQNGKVAAGEWIDIIRFRDWLAEEIKIRVFRLLITNDKVPYTDPGIAMVENQIRGALKLGQDRGGIAPTEYDEFDVANPGFTVEVPLSSNISSNDKASRILNDVKFNARPAGAIHVVEIRGSLTYDSLAGQEVA